MRTQPSLVLITTDCLRADHCGFMGYNRPTTPFLDTLASQSWVFTNAIVAGTPTYYSLPAIMASRYPLALGRDVVGLAPDEPTLASTLRSAGYATACFSAGNPYVSRQFGYDQGFDTFRDLLEREVAGFRRTNPPINDRNGLLFRANRQLAQLCKQLGISSVYDALYFQYCQRVAAPPHSLDALRRFPSVDIIVDHAEAWLASLGRGPFFLWLHLMDPHSPYYPVQNALCLLGNGRVTPFQARYLNEYWNRGGLRSSRLAKHRDEMIKLYDACIRWVDTQVECLVGRLQQSKLWDNCTLAFTADHGEEFLEHGDCYHAPSKLIEELVHVPLLLRVPGEGSRVAQSPFSLLHLAPTVLDILGIRVPSDFRGTSHRLQIQHGENWDTPTLTECVSSCKNPFVLDDCMGPRLLAVRQRQHKLVIDFKNGEYQLFDLETDPAERTPLPPHAERPTRCKLLEVAAAHIGSSRAKKSSRVRLNALLQEVKRTLGDEISSRPKQGQVLGDSELAAAV